MYVSTSLVLLVTINVVAVDGEPWLICPACRSIMQSLAGILSVSRNEVQAEFEGVR
jgi:hypothetical protein